METILNKIQFLCEDFPDYLLSIDPATKPLWGKMSVIQMIDHMSDSVRIANGKDEIALHTPADEVPKYKAFVLSDRLFKPNTKNALMGEEPEPARNSNLEDAVGELEMEIADFVRYFEGHPGETILNPFFGELTFEEWVQLLWKHSVHHLAQFGVQVKEQD